MSHTVPAVFHSHPLQPQVLTRLLKHVIATQLRVLHRAAVHLELHRALGEPPWLRDRQGVLSI